MTVKAARVAPPDPTPHTASPRYTRTPACACPAAPQEEAPKPGLVDPYEEFKKVFERFASAEEVTGQVEVKDEDEEVRAAEEVQDARRGWGGAAAGLRKL